MEPNPQSGRWLQQPTGPLSPTRPPACHTPPACLPHPAMLLYGDRGWNARSGGRRSCVGTGWELSWSSGLITAPELLNQQQCRLTSEWRAVLLWWVMGVSTPPRRRIARRPPFKGNWAGRALIALLGGITWRHPATEYKNAFPRDNSAMPCTCKSIHTRSCSKHSCRFRFLKMHVLYESASYLVPLIFT